MKETVLYQRVEAGFILLACLIYYNHLRFNPLLFIILLFTPDISMAGYVKNNKIGALSYNSVHNFAVPAVLVVLGAIVPCNLLLGGGLIWASHVALDRALGYCLKFDSGFNDTHLGKIGKKK